MKQLVVSAAPDSEGIIKLTEKDYHYLVSVRRIKKGQTVYISADGKAAALAEVLRIHTEKRYIELKLKSAPSAKSVFPYPPIILMQWVIKGTHMDTAVRQCTEAGAAAIFPVLGAFSVIRKENKNQTDRRKRIIREARQQSGSPVETVLFEAAPLEHALRSVFAYLGGKKTSFLLLTEENADAAALYENLQDGCEATVLAVGCEGGISPEEKKILLQAGFKQVHFKTNVLRAETAAVYAVAAVQTVFGLRR